MWWNLIAATALAASAAAVGQQADAPRQVTACTANQLSGEIRDVDAGAGQRYGTLRVRNTSSATCSLTGYGDLRLLAGDHPNPTNAVPTANPGPSRVVLRSGQSADQKLHWGVIPSGNEGDPCQPPSNGLRVVPPDGKRSFVVRFEFGSVCIGGRIEHSAYFPAGT
ncbi:DUF4232 domain-containing protein [Actinokineospora enzanensis]|uniref:DUF4232 domain-containing protein n=1 Tax=Actinokineospora enzanensis TaxID=155975 RepID=UPI0003733AEF|nr:DUF4232 domain-containing protein [Actinokineospora enzanensis]